MKVWLDRDEWYVYVLLDEDRPARPLAEVDLPDEVVEQYREAEFRFEQADKRLRKAIAAANVGLEE